jgi:HlyD family secretion protein
MSSRLPFYIAGAVVVAAAGYFFLSGSDSNTATGSSETAATGSAEAGATAPAPTAPSITVAKVQSAVLNDRVRASGLVDAVERVLVQPKIEGQPIDSVLGRCRGPRRRRGSTCDPVGQCSEAAEKPVVASRASALASIAQADAQLVEAQASADEAKRTKDRNDQLKRAR